MEKIQFWDCIFVDNKNDYCCYWCYAQSGKILVKATKFWDFGDGTYGATCSDPSHNFEQESSTSQITKEEFDMTRILNE